MKAKRIWIAVNPFDETDVVIRTDEPSYPESFYSDLDKDWEHPEDSEWQEYIAIPVES